MRRRLFLLSITILIAVPAFADWEQTFREGVRNYEKRKYADTIEFMKVAIQLKPAADGASVNINGGFNANYTPYHYLAAAHAQLGQCDEATAAMRSAQGGAKNPEMTKVVESKCGKMNLGPTPAELEAQRKAEEAKKAETARLEEQRKQAEAARIAEENKKKEDAKRAEEARIAEDNRKKKEAEDTRVAEEKRKADEAAATAKLAEETKKAEEQRKADEAKKAEETRIAEQKRKEAEAKKVADDLADAKKTFGGLVSRSKSLLAAAQEAGPAREALSAAVSDTSPLKATDIAPVATAHAALSKLYDDYLKVVTAGNSESAQRLNFKAAIEAYMGGHYDQAMALLAKVNYAGVLKAQSALFKAASKFANSQLKSDTSVATVAGIIADLGEFRRLQPEAKLDPRMFSPAFRDFVAQQSAH